MDEDIKKSEAYSDVGNIIDKYKNFCFGIISKVGYGRVPAWIAFTEGKMEEAFKERRTLTQSIKDYYVLTVLNWLLTLIGFWYLVLIYGGLFAIMVPILAIASPLIAAAVIIGVIAVLIFAPLVFFLLTGALFHILARFFGGKGSYSDTLSVVVMHSAASLILMIPIHLAYATVIGMLISPLSYLVMFYGIYLFYKGMRHVHGMSSRDAAVAIIAGYVIEIGLGIAIGLAFYLLMFMYMITSKGG